MDEQFGCGDWGGPWKDAEQKEFTVGRWMDEVFGVFLQEVHFLDPSINSPQVLEKSGSGNLPTMF